MSLIVEEIKEGGYFKNSKINTGFTTNTEIEHDSQFLLYEELDKCASLITLNSLLNNESNIIVAFSWRSILKKSPTLAFNFFIDNFDVLQERFFYEFLNHCQGTVNKSLAKYMTQEISSRIKENSVNLKEKEILAFRKLIKSKRKVVTSKLIISDF